MSKLYFIADIGANHDGDIKRAFSLIELAKESGADAAKFQNYTADGLVSKKGFDGLKIGHQASWEKSVFDTYDAASIDRSWTQLLKAKCKEVNIDYFTSPYSFEDVDLVNPYVDKYKIGSGDITYVDLIRYIAMKNKPILLATGASSMSDVIRAVSIIYAYNNSELTLMQCNTNYTAEEKNFKYINLKVLKTFRKIFPDVSLGLSDHTLGDTTVLGAIALGATVIEKHFTDDRSRPGNDHSFAMEPQEWKFMVKKSYDLLHALGSGIKQVEFNEKETVILQRRSLRYAYDLKEGTILTYKDFIADIVTGKL